VKHCVRLVDDFRLGGQLGIAMEALHINLRKLLKSYGANQGIAVKAVSCGEAVIMMGYGQSIAKVCLALEGA
jgi:hypothetical protein